MTLWASSVALKLELETSSKRFETTLPLAEVTQGVIAHGAAPDTNSDRVVSVWLSLMTTIATVPSVGFL